MKHRNRVLVLGAGRGQVGLIAASKALGYTTVVATLPGSAAAGSKLADEVLHVDIAEPDAVVDAARRANVGGVATSCLDTGVPALGRVRDELGLIGLSGDAANLCADKLLMKAAFEKAGVQSARYRMVDTEFALKHALSELGFPLIIKATDLQGSQGITIAHDEAMAWDGFQHAKELTSRKEVLVEEFIVGEEFGAQAMVSRGEILFVLPHADEVVMARTAVPVGHSVPLGFDPVVEKSAISETVKAIRAIGLDDCAVNVDLIVSLGKVYVIELTGRVGANGLPEMVSGHFGIDYFSVISALAMGEDPRPLLKSYGEMERPAVAVRMLVAEDAYGEVSSITVDESRAEDADILIFKEEGDVLNGFSSSADCIGQIAVVAPTASEAAEKLSRVERAISIKVKKSS